MAYRKSTYSKTQTIDIKTRIFGVLCEADSALNIEQIKCRDIGLNGITTQKMARELNSLVDMGAAYKGKKGTRMIYAIDKEYLV